MTNSSKVDHERVDLSWEIILSLPDIDKNGYLKFKDTSIFNPFHFEVLLPKEVTQDMSSLEEYLETEMNDTCFAEPNHRNINIWEEHKSKFRWDFR